MLPLEFKERMERLLGDEAQKLFYEIENGDAVRAFHVNGAKISRNDFENGGAVIDKTPLCGLENAYATRESFPGSLPEHHSGAIYMQDPSAMATVAAVKVERGMRVLDSCAAPGGKTGQLAALVGEHGMVVANEYDAHRSRILQGNVERLGLKNTVVLNLDTKYLAQAYPDLFDLVVCDAPCSGEGMFRKNDRAIDEWSLQNVQMCAERQREILANVVKCVKRGGRLLYSTCTFAVEENEQNVAWLLENYPDFELIEVSEEIKRITADGIMLDGCDYDMKKARRFYPHVSAGEGQFIALFSRCDDCVLNCLEAKNSPKSHEKCGKNREKVNKVARNKQEIELIELGKRFLDENVEGELVGELRVMGDKLWLCPDVELTAFGVVAAGVCVGEGQKGRFVPHHQLFSAYGCQFKRQFRMGNKSAFAINYLYGEELSLGGVALGENRSAGVALGEKRLGGACDECNAVGCEAVGCETVGGEADRYLAPANDMNGWAAVVIGGCGCGGAKVSGCAASEGELVSGVAKNHYPKGLRNKRIG